MCDSCLLGDKIDIPTTSINKSLPISLQHLYQSLRVVGLCWIYMHFEYWYDDVYDMARSHSDCIGKKM